jgi:hypothetical protein
MDSLILNTPIKDKLTGYLIKIEHDHFEIRKNLEMKHRVSRVFYTNAGTEEEPIFGEPLLDVIQEKFDNDELTESQFIKAREMFRTTYFESDTQDKMVNPATGQAVLADEETGEYPEGSVTELQFWQSLPHAMFAGDATADKVYGGLLLSMQSMKANERI